LQRRNEIMQSIQRFVNSLQKLFSAGRRCETAATPTTANPSTRAAAAFAVRFVLRGGEY